MTERLHNTKTGKDFTELETLFIKALVHRLYAEPCLEDRPTNRDSRRRGRGVGQTSWVFEIAGLNDYLRKGLARGNQAVTGKLEGVCPFTLPPRHARA